MITNRLKKALFSHDKHPSAFFQNIPYYSQWESAQLVNQFLKYQELPRNDPQWKNSGANSPLEYEFWSYHLCGIACFKMIVKKIFNINIKTIVTAKESVSFGCYKPQNIPLTNKYSTHPSHIDGLYYKPFSKYIRKKWNLHAEVHSHLSLKHIKHMISSNKHLIISVDPRIREGKTIPNPQPGGHLVVVTGYNDNLEQISIHNPSGYYPHTQTNHQVDYEIFNQLCAFRGISIYK